MHAWAPISLFLLIETNSIILNQSFSIYSSSEWQLWEETSKSSEPDSLFSENSSIVERMENFLRLGNANE